MTPTELDAKKSIKYHMKFFKGLLNNITFGDEIFKNRAMWATWCLHRYINNQLINDIEKAIKEHGAKSE